MTLGIKSSNSLNRKEKAVPKKKIRAFSIHKPKWQRFQTSLIIPSTKTAAATAAAGGNSQQQQQQLHPYQRQYSHVYHHRLRMLKNRCWETVDTVLKDTGSVTKVDRVLDLRENKMSMIVGTLIKENTTNDGSKDNMIHPNTKCCSSDELFLEDESGRVALQIMNNDNTKNTTGVHEYCTGIVVAVQGIITPNSNGVMNVSQVFYPSLPSSTAKKTVTSTTETPTTKQQQPHLLLVSGLDCGDPDISTLPRQMLISYLRGLYDDNNSTNGDETVDINSAAKVSRVVIAGGCCYDGSSSNNNNATNTTSNTSTKTSSAPSYNTLDGIRELDTFCFQLIASCGGLPIDILPGKNDPTTANWPQRPLHSSLLKYTTLINDNLIGSNSASSLVSRTPNPYAAYHGTATTTTATTNNRLVVGTDGANIQDLAQSIVIYKNNKDNSDIIENNDSINIDSSNPDKKDENDNTKENGTIRPITELEALKLTLMKYNHLCPTGPDSIPTIPHKEGYDPMVIEEFPNIYFAGNCDSFATCTTTSSNTQGEDKCRLICIPKFSKTNEVVLVNLVTLEVELLKFDCPSLP